MGCGISEFRERWNRPSEVLKTLLESPQSQIRALPGDGGLKLKTSQEVVARDTAHDLGWSHGHEPEWVKSVQSFIQS
jgi:hypothetical protein